MNRLGYLIAALLLFAGAAQASQQGQVVLNNWKAADKFAKQAQAAYPDYSAEAKAKRDAKLKECLNSGNLAPRQTLSPPLPR